MHSLYEWFMYHLQKISYVTCPDEKVCHNARLVEFGGTSLLPLVLPADYVNIVVVLLSGLVEAMCRNERFVCRCEDKFFSIHSTGSYRIARFTHVKQLISLKLHELRNFQYIFHMRRTVYSHGGFFLRLMYGISTACHHAT